ncbi:filamentous hemagglutinin N-terminal domain-containing protein, partial [Kamptonema animale CS-326]|uniref:two-partner secretion domain-containing protein n=1 Tax=Kamptonema animale TaxID=92934 RepID=UPI00232DF1C1
MKASIKNSCKFLTAFNNLQMGFFSIKKTRNQLIFPVSFLLFSFSFLVPSLKAQTIVPATDGTDTTVTPQGERFDIEGGQLSSDKANLFHSFQQFGLSENQIANFISNPNIRNILARVVGGDASIINGLIQVTGGNSNLFLINPSGMIFGANASLNVAGSFTATTATGIGIGTNWFNAEGTNDYATLVGTPSSFAFPSGQPGVIINSADLAVKSGQNLTLLGGTVISTGTLSAPDGQVTVVSVPAENLVRISQDGHLLSLEIKPLSGGDATAQSAENDQAPSSTTNTSETPKGQPTPWTLPIATLPELLTGSGKSSATGISVNESGQVVLTGGNQTVAAGDVATQEVNAGAIAIQAAGNITINGNLSTVESTSSGPIALNATGNLTVSGNISTSLGEISLSSSSGSLDTAKSTITSEGGAIALEAETDIRAGAIDSHSTAIDGGNITLTSRTGIIEAGNLSSWSDAKNGDGGDIIVSALLSIKAGEIDAHSDDKQGGAVTLDPQDDIEVVFINTQGRTAGGNIDITAGRYFRATGSFISEPFCSEGCSLSAATTGSANAGDITIRHGGTALNTPFTVGPDYNGLNGTAGTIVTGGTPQPNSITSGSYDSPLPQRRGPTAIDITASTPAPAPAPAPAP